MTTPRVTLIQGGGIGYDIAPAVQHVLRYAGAEVVWDEYLAGGAAVDQGEAGLSDSLLQSVHDNGLALKTKLLPSAEHVHFNWDLQFRRQLGLFATVRPLRNLPGLNARFRDVDVYVIRELTEGLYASIEHEIVPGVIQSINVVTETASRRLFRFAMQWAKDHGRKTVHCVHKANILKLTDGLFLEAFRATAKEFPDLEPREIIVDNCCMQLVTRPQQFDVMVMGSLYGDIVSDLGAGLVGGVAATSGLNLSENIRVYETFHGAAREVVGENRANPLPLLLPAVDLLKYIQQTECARRIQQAVHSVLTDGRVRTSDLDGEAYTNEFADAVCAAMD